jgi:ketosteroid isomerase-like protein
MEDTRRVIERLVAATNAHDLNRLVECFAESYVNETPAHPGRGFRGRQQVRRNWATISPPSPTLSLVSSAVPWRTARYGPSGR